MADLLSVAKSAFPRARILLNSVLIRSDVSHRALSLFNEQLFLMCNNFGVEFVDASRLVSKRHLARDGRHLSRLGNHLLSEFLCQAMMKSHENRDSQTVNVTPCNDSVVSVLSSLPSYPQPIPLSGNETGQPSQVLR